MKHVGFSDIKHAISIGSMVGKLPADDMHKNLCRCHIEFFDTYLKKLKNFPEPESNDVIRYAVYEPDMS